VLNKPMLRKSRIGGELNTGSVSQRPRSAVLASGWAWPEPKIESNIGRPIQTGGRELQSMA
jgi:hypothetical protein